MKTHPQSYKQYNTNSAYLFDVLLHKAQHTTVTINGHTTVVWNPNVNKGLSNLAISVFAFNQTQTWTSLLTAEQHTERAKISDEVKHNCQRKKNKRLCFLN